MVRKTIGIEGVGMLSYQVTNEADHALVCVHGLGQSSIMWERAIEGLPNGWQGHALDLFGFGDSDKPQTGYSIRFHADTVARFIAQLPHKKVVLAANSMGGSVALAVAIEHGEIDLAGLILVSAGAGVSNREAAERYRNELERTPVTVDVARQRARNYTHHDLDDALFERVVKVVLKANHAALYETTASSIETDHTPNLGRVQVPTAVIQGMMDDRRTPEGGLVIARGVQNGRLIAVPEVGHTPMLEAPSEFQVWLNAMLGLLNT